MPSVENPGVAMYTKAMEIHKEVIQRLPKFIEFLVKKYKITGTSWNYVIPHQTSSRAIKTALDLCAHSLETLPETLMSLGRFGNTSSTSHFVVLDDHLSSKRLKKNSRIIFLPLASGIVVGFVSAAIGKLEEKYGYNN
jgi:3-oxoacyl-[acyl-carrier-protein] synthase III